MFDFQTSKVCFCGPEYGNLKIKRSVCLEMASFFPYSACLHRLLTVRRPKHLRDIRKERTHEVQGNSTTVKVALP